MIEGNTMPTVDWPAAGDALYRAAAADFVRFLGGPVRDEVYAVGLFFDTFYGTALPVANTMAYHTKSYRAFVQEYGPADEFPYLWNSGNWAYPAGLGESSSFDAIWDPWARRIEAAVASSLKESPDADAAEVEAAFRACCVDVLRRLASDGAFAGVPHLMGCVVQSPDDADADLVAEKDRVTATVGMSGG